MLKIKLKKYFSGFWRQMVFGLLWVCRILFVFVLCYCDLGEVIQFFSFLVFVFSIYKMSIKDGQSFFFEGFDFDFDLSDLIDLIEGYLRLVFQEVCICGFLKVILIMKSKVLMCCLLIYFKYMNKIFVFFIVVVEFV